jgi:aconitate hydratase
LTGHETFTINRLDDSLKPLQNLSITATRPDGSKKEFAANCRIDTPVEIEYYRNGGILQTVLRKMLRSS